MRHAEKLIGRILFLEGSPNEICIGDKIPEQVENDCLAEEGAIKAYNDAIALAEEVRDHATRDILAAILTDEDAHIDEIEELQEQIGQMTLPIFLATQTN